MTHGTTDTAQLGGNPADLPTLLPVVKQPRTVTISDTAYEYLQQQTVGQPDSIAARLDAIIAEDGDRWQHACQNEEPTA